MEAEMNDLKIIITDDNLPFLEGLEFMLSTSDNYKIVNKHHTGKELLESISLVDAHLILTDIDMPEMSGIEAAKRINYLFPHLKMIALTMHLDKVFLRDIIEAGFKGFIYKPDTAKLLFNTISEVMNNKFVFPEVLKSK